jgi:hypothetical protein
MSSQKIYYSKIYRDFKAIESAPAAFRRVVLFYEEHEKEILKLEFQENFELLVAYAQSLLEIGEHKKCLLITETIIDITMSENIGSFRGRDVYFETLFIKAAAHFNLQELKAAKHIVHELIRIKPWEEKPILFLEKILHDENPIPVRRIRALTILLLLSSTVVIFLEVLVVRHFFEYWAKSFEFGRNILLISALVVLVFGTLFFRLRAHYRTQKFVTYCRKRKKVDLLDNF